MSNFQISFILFITLLIGILIGAYYQIMAWWWIVPLHIFYWLFLGIQSSNIRSNFFIQTISHIDTEEPVVYLTYDDGPHNVYTPNLLEVLDRYGVQVTFFCIGDKVEKHEEIIKNIIEHGHDIGLHSYSHSVWYGFYPSRMIRSDTTRVQDALFHASGKRSQWFRPPYGVTNPSIARAIGDHYKVIGWTIRSYDTMDKMVDRIHDRIMKKLEPGAIILLHDHLPLTAELTARLIESIRLEGYQIGHLAEALEKPVYAIH